MHACPGCEHSIRAEFFLCMECASVTPDALIVKIGAAVDAGNRGSVEAGLAEAVKLINEG